MISHVYLSAVLMLATLPVVWCQCTTSRCQDSKYEPPRWENGAVYLESLLTETSERILSVVESLLVDQTATVASRLADQTATMESRLANQTATMESRLAQQAEAVDARLATLKAELENSTSDRMEALESRLAERSAAIERRLVDLTTTIANHLAQHTEAMDVRLATLNTGLENTMTKRLEALEERMVVESGNLANNSESRLNLAMMNNMESHLAEYTEAVDARLTTLKTELENATIDRLEALRERMVVENRNLVTNSESRLNLTIGAMMNNVERRLADQTGTMESSLAGLAATIESSLVGLTSTIESRLADHAEAVEVGLATLKTELGNTTTDRLGALEERMVVESRNATTSSESRLNLTIGAMMNNMESSLADQSATIESRLTDQTATIERRLAQHFEAVDERLATLKTTLENTTTGRLEPLEEKMVAESHNLASNSESRLNLTIGAILNNMEAALTTLCSSRVSDQLMAAVSYASNVQAPLEISDCLTFLRRIDGSVDFTRNWADYKSGFGDNNEFWLGLEKLHQLTTQHEYGLRVDMEDFYGARKWASYQVFRVGSESGNYVLTVSGYNTDSTAGDSMDFHNGRQFTTVDRGNDGANCAASRKGGWWYNFCHYALPTGEYNPVGNIPDKGINWYHAYSDWRSFKSMSLKLVGN